MEFRDSKFSVILPILDRDDIVKGFPLAIQSIFNNSIKPDQVLVVVDGLVSESFKAFLKNYEEKYSIEIIWSTRKLGLDKALNLALSKCRNEIVLRADGDDININNRFELQLPYLLSGYDVVGSNIDEYDESGKYISSRIVPQKNEDIKKMIPFRNPMNHMTVGFLKTPVLEVNGYPELFLKGDYGLWIKLFAKNKKFFNLKESLVKATTGSRMIQDRGGLRYIYSEFLLQNYLLKFKLTKIWIALIIFITRSLVFSLPPFLRGFIYKVFLRNKKS